MHVIFRENHTLDDTDVPFDVNQTAAELIVLSFSDSDLGAFLAGWHRAKNIPDNENIPTLRLVNLIALKHPLSVDTYIEKTASHAKGILIRLIGGKNYWSYGLMQLQDIARKKDIALAIIPGDGREDPQLDELSTVPVSTLRRLKTLCDYGGEVAAQAALAQLSVAAGLYFKPVKGKKEISACGFFCPNLGVISEEKVESLINTENPTFILSFYRSYLTASDLDPIKQLIESMRTKGFNCFGVFVTSLKDKNVVKWLDLALSKFPINAIINATAFSARGGPTNTSPLDKPDCPVFQVSLSTARKFEWEASDRGLSPADLAMHVVLPEVDGRLFAGVISFKAPKPRDSDLQYSRFSHETSIKELDSVLNKVTAWYQLAKKPASDKNLILVLSTYPGKDYQMGHAVGLDTMASAKEILSQLLKNGYNTEPLTGEKLNDLLKISKVKWGLEEYLESLKSIPKQLADEISTNWGDASQDSCVKNGYFEFSVVKLGTIYVGLQPERGNIHDRESNYHNLQNCPNHGYVAFYLWIQSNKTDAVIHIGAHGTLEWLPGKSVALSEFCWPRALSNNLPVIYPFIVNDPGEAAQAKRRLCAITIGHAPPPMIIGEFSEDLHILEKLLDEYSTAEGLDPQRQARLANDIRLEAKGRGLEKDLNIKISDNAAAAITKIDSFVCDVKASQFGKGLHTFGKGDNGSFEIQGLLNALNGERVQPGPSGSPFRGKSNVLPTGRNLFTIDPRAVPSKSAHDQGIKLANEVIRKYLQDNGDYPKGIIIDLWGSATMRTAGEEFSMALHLAGIAPCWDKDSDRVSGFEIIALSVLGRPRIDVSLRVSGLFRDVFPVLAQMFDKAIEQLAARDEPQFDNPYKSYAPRVYGPKPGSFGVGLNSFIETLDEETKSKAGDAWLNASSWAIRKDGTTSEDRNGLEERILSADTFVHVQDLPETDLLIASDYAAHEGGFAAAVRYLGDKKKNMYHVDTTNPEQAKARSLEEEISRVVRARATNPEWINGMMEHGFRGAAEIASTLDNMAAFANLADAVPPHLFDLYYVATLGDPNVSKFLENENPQASEAMKNKFRELQRSGIWHSQRNSTIFDFEVAGG